ncbi:Binding-like protein-dependent transport systems inner membrane component [Raphidiopsis brookii D9]|nr:Binding-like protein-dependent transport systems inner membrane component [Raphidiopsis brookii D9]
MSRSKALQYYIASRLLFAPLQLLTILTIVFLLLRATPGDPADAILGGRAPESAKEELRKQLGLDLPIWLQYINYLGNILRFDLGTSLTSRGQNVWQIISQHFPATVELAVCSMLVALIVGILVGTLSASRPGTPLDLGGRLFGIITYALPMFWAGMLLQLVFSVQLQWFPNSNRFPPNISPPTTITGLYTIDSLLGGNLNLFFPGLASFSSTQFNPRNFIKWHFERIVRVNLKETLKADYVEAARARGIPENKILVSHALKNALIPVITVLGLTFASLLGGAILTEVTFSWPGLANRLYQAIADRDYTTVQGVLVFFGAIVVSASIVIDILNAYIDPRIRY